MKQTDMTPVQVGNKAETKVLKYFRTHCKHVAEHEARWVAMWVKKEVREAIKRERADRG